MSIYDYQATLENGETYSLANYEGQPLVIVNTATKCGLSPQFKELQSLYETYKDQGLVVLGFPSDQFKQEVGSAEEAAAACRTTYGVDFPMHKLTVINGKDADPFVSLFGSRSTGYIRQSH